ncbi:hypothetical protein NECAME_08392 [Necator americanus]|uniref:Uncharacterized protein n=1 Tax=Necator americanus TaxID=51031 RepID=W2TJ16_NECAM|nr:hypothetical protein NECAME_08392 [Necator americanus]ETN81594.1 hypothetical protein NECAME_08392 [Necator americanus]
MCEYALCIGYEYITYRSGTYEKEMNWDTEPKPTSGRIFRSFGQDLESVVFAVVAFLSGGVVLFIGCFIVTKCFQFYKERVRRKRRRAMGVDDDELNDAVLSGAFDTEVCEEEESRLVSI